MKNTIYLLFLAFCISFNVNAQNVYPLGTSFISLPDKAYLKDLNNELDSYIGKYAAMDNGKIIELNITKHLKVEAPGTANNIYYQDVLRVKVVIKNQQGQLIYENFTHPDDEFKSTFIMPARDTLVFYYSGTNCAVGWGSIFLKKLNATQIQWNYKPESARTEKCPNADLTLYLPQTKDLIFTKQ
ncbi:hypothetical protein [Bergeyella zoohelcum]|uniref:GLPGLI family protein n=1 Tax=Bergeyella zoohelcum TaxID=1015 RepID=A0A7Z8YNS4_9FLAO|nr:hypothetical protein [Bergeyella zoohelcum]VDH03645.1 Uncharacterised protein [Bergeyella zoohelcum]